MSKIIDRIIMKRTRTSSDTLALATTFFIMGIAAKWIETRLAIITTVILIFTVGIFEIIEGKYYG